jgi:hypothetical protein
MEEIKIALRRCRMSRFLSRHHGQSCLGNNSQQKKGQARALHMRVH